MNKRVVSVFMLLGILLSPYTAGVQAAERFKPFVLAFKGAAAFSAKMDETKRALTSAGFDIVGEFRPYAETFVDDAAIIIVTNDELKRFSGMSRYGGFAAPWRVAVTQIGNEVQVAYANPAYFANAYRLQSDLSGLSTVLKQSLGAIDTFGARRGMTASKLRKYHYTFGMEYFDDPYRLASYRSHDQAVAVVEKNLAAAIAGVTKVYRLDLPNDVKVFGVARRAASEADKFMDDSVIMGLVDVAELKGTANLPYEMMVDGKDVVALHMRFRMALHYPDMKMAGRNSFMSIISSPDAVRKALTQAAGGTIKNAYDPIMIDR